MLPLQITPQKLKPGEYDDSQWGLRPDGSKKSSGWLGVYQRPDGNVSSELSVGVPINGTETDIPTMVPGLTPDELSWLLTTPEDQIAQNLPQSIMQKAIAHAQQRIASGQSPFFESPMPQGGSNIIRQVLEGTH